MLLCVANVLQGSGLWENPRKYVLMERLSLVRARPLIAAASKELDLVNLFHEDAHLLKG